MPVDLTLRLEEEPIAELVVRASSEPVLDPSDEDRLAAMVPEGHPDALRTLIRANLRVAIDEAIRDRGQGEPQAAMVRRGMRALVEAVERYRPDAHGPFALYVRRAVRVAIRRVAHH